MLRLLYEHNILNGFAFVLAEFVIAALAALYISYVGLARGSLLLGIIGLGIAVNAGVVCFTVLRQLRRGERDIGLYKTYFGSDRESIHREHPNLDRHTLQICLVLLVPFLLLILVLV